MANVDRVRGFEPVGFLSGASYNGESRRCYVPSGQDKALAVGDIVKLLANGASKNVPNVTDSDAGDCPCGVITSIERWEDGILDPTYLPASTGAYVLVCMDPNLVMRVQSSGTVEDGDVGANADLVAAGVDTDSGASGMEIDQSTVNTTNTLIFFILEVEDRADNELGANADLLVGFNIHQYGHGADTTGSTGSTGVHA
ncbi:MAG: hypothetical protein KOO63_05590 [Bacteroidales bacterium]|nr:hypothetical protein [Candidatus Latescibacterota bacterium]